VTRSSDVRSKRGIAPWLGLREYVVLTILLTLPLAACGGRGAAPPTSSPAPSSALATPPPVRGPAAETARVAHDVDVVKQAQDVANGILQKASDCAGLKAGLADAQSALDDAYERARTDAGRDTITGLRKQIQNAASACP
jgi:hypothetical protein